MDRENTVLLEESFGYYLKNVRNNSQSTVNHYFDALNTISKFLKKKGKITGSVFQVNDYADLEILKEYLLMDKEFISLDCKGHRMYSAAINNYLKFAKVEGFEKIGRGIERVDVPISVPKEEQRIVKEWVRSPIVKQHVIKISNYKCEIDETHITFTSRTWDKPYMEAHHLIPMNKQKKFKSSLDVYANVVCLCPLCHRFLHHGVDELRKEKLIQLYRNRHSRLENSGIVINEGDFLSEVL